MSQDPNEVRLDDLRQSLLQAEPQMVNMEAYLDKEVHSDRIFGMTAAERMFVSIGCFLVTTLGGFLLLLAMEKIVI